MADPVSTLVDCFDGDSLDTGLWEEFDPFGFPAGQGSVIVSGGELVISITDKEVPVDIAARGIITRVAYDIDSDGVVLVLAPGGPDLLNNREESELLIFGTWDFLPGLVMFTKDGSTPIVLAGFTRLELDWGTERFWKIRHDPGEVAWKIESSSDGQNWTTRHSSGGPTGTFKISVHARGFWGEEEAATPFEFRIEGVNCIDPPPPPPSGGGSVSLPFPEGINLDPIELYLTDLTTTTADLETSPFFDPDGYPHVQTRFDVAWFDSVTRLWYPLGVWVMEDTGTGYRLLLNGEEVETYNYGEEPELFMRRLALTGLTPGRLYAAIAAHKADDGADGIWRVTKALFFNALPIDTARTPRDHTLIELWSDFACAGGERLAVVHDGNPLTAVKAIEAELFISIDNRDRLTLAVPADVWWLDQAWLRRVFRCEDKLGRITEWRITHSERSYIGGQPVVRFQAEPVIMDLGACGLVYDLSVAGRPYYNIGGVQLPAWQYLDTFIIQGAHRNTLGWLVRGDVGYTDAIDLSLNRATPLEWLNAVATKLKAEARLRRIGETNYALDVVEAVGADREIVLVQPIRNLLSLRKTHDVSGMATVIIPAGRVIEGDSERTGIEQAAWKVESADLWDTRFNEADASDVSETYLYLWMDRYGPETTPNPAVFRVAGVNCAEEAPLPADLISLEDCFDGDTLDEQWTEETSDEPGDTYVADGALVFEIAPVSEVYTYRDVVTVDPIDFREKSVVVSLGSTPAEMGEHAHGGCYLYYSDEAALDLQWYVNAGQPKAWMNGTEIDVDWGLYRHWWIRHTGSGWEVQAASDSGAIVLVDPGGGDGPCQFKDQMTGMYAVLPDGTLAEVTASEKLTNERSRITLASVAGLDEGDLIEFRADEHGTLLTELTNPAAVKQYGRIVGNYEDDEARSERNHVPNPFFSSWPAVPSVQVCRKDGAQAGTPTITLKDLPPGYTIEPGWLFGRIGVNSVIREVLVGDTADGSGKATITLTAAAPWADDEQLFVFETSDGYDDYRTPDSWFTPSSPFGLYAPVFQRSRVYDDRPVTGNLACVVDGNHTDALTAKLRDLPSDQLIQFGDVLVVNSKRYLILSTVDTGAGGGVELIVSPVFNADDGDPAAIVRPLLLGAGGETVAAIPTIMDGNPLVSDIIPLRPYEAVQSVWISVGMTVFNAGSVGTDTWTTGTGDNQSHPPKLRIRNADTLQTLREVRYEPGMIAPGQELSINLRGQIEITEPTNIIVEVYGPYHDATSTRRMFDVIAFVRWVQVAITSDPSTPVVEGSHGNKLWQAANKRLALLSRAPATYECTVMDLAMAAGYDPEWEEIDLGTLIRFPPEYSDDELRVVAYQQDLVNPVPLVLTLDSRPDLMATYAAARRHKPAYVAIEGEAGRESHATTERPDPLTDGSMRAVGEGSAPAPHFPRPAMIRRYTRSGGET